MSITQAGGAVGAERFEHIEALLKSYPNISEDQLKELKIWWNKEASALDVGLLASKDDLQANYRRFRAEHIDAFKAKDVALGILGLISILAVIAMIGILAV